jgi:sugar phosphate isomerase/epimerase
MRISISNLAWEVAEDQAVVAILNARGIDAIDVVPGKYFPHPSIASDTDISRVRDWWNDRGISIVGMQALLFGTTGLNMFGSYETQSTMLAYLATVCRIGAGLGASKLVFGSPRNRDRFGLTNDVAHEIAVIFFRRLGDIADKYGVMVCLEPTPSCYGANFMVGSDETANIVTLVAHPAIRMQLDTGSLTINCEDTHQIIKDYAALIGHIHASEPDLVTLGDAGTNHAAVAEMLDVYLPDQVVTIEMLPAKNGLNLIAVEKAIIVARKYYGDADTLQLSSA